MPIYDESYRSWQGQLETKPRTWWVIVRNGVKLVWRKLMILFLIAAYVPFVVGAVQIYLMSRFGEKLGVARNIQGAEINPAFFYKFIQGPWLYLMLLLFVIFSGAGLIANDRKFKALPIYFSKPVNFWDYILGKFMVIGFYGSLITLVPGLLLFLMKVLVSENTVFLKTYFWIPFSIIGFSLLMLLILGSVMMALSGASRGTRAVAILFFGVIWFPDLIRGIFTRIPEMGLLSLSADLRQIGALMFGVDNPFSFSPWLSGLVLTAVFLFCLFFLRWRVKPTEVVK
jgi:hypothetical protein